MNLNSRLVFVFLFAATSVVFSQSYPNFTLLTSESIPLPQNQLYYNGSYFFGEGLRYDPTNDEIIQYYPVSSCQDVTYNNYYISPDSKFYCIVAQETTEIIQFNPFSGQTIAKYYYTLGAAEFRIQRYYILLTSTFNDNTTFQVFDTRKNEFTCNFGPISGVPQFTFAILANFTLFLLTQDSIVTYYNCGNGIGETASLGTVGIPDMIGSFNDTAVLFVSSPQINGFYDDIIPFGLNSDGDVAVYNRIQLSLLGQYNGTHFVIQSIGSNNQKIYSIIYFDANLNPITVASYDTQLSIDDIQGYIVYGESSLLIELESTYALKWNFDKNEIVDFFPLDPPIQMANGSLVYLGYNGYYLRNIGSPIIFQHWDLSSLFVQSSSDPNVFYNLGLPYPSSSICYIALINATANLLLYQTIPNCPSSVKPPYFVKDVQYNSDGQIYIAYKDLTQQIFILQSDGSVNAFRPIAPYEFCGVSLNPTTQVITVGFGLLGAIRIEAYGFDGNTLYGFTFKGAGQNLISTVGDSIFIAACSSFTATTFLIINGATGAQIAQFAVGEPLAPYSANGITNPYFALGVDPNNSSSVGGIVCWTKTAVYVYNTAGYGGPIDIGANIFFQASQINQSFFSVTLYSPADNGTSIVIQNYYQVVDWTIPLIEKYISI